MTSKVVTVPVITTAMQASSTIALRNSHHLPEAFRCRGRGGGSPEGRRRLRTRAIAGGAGRATRTAEPTPGGACGSEAMPRMFPPKGAGVIPFRRRSALP
jgi:hypothetical protein